MGNSIAFSSSSTPGESDNRKSMIINEGAFWRKENLWKSDSNDKSHQQCADKFSSTHAALTQLSVVKVESSHP